MKTFINNVMASSILVFTCFYFLPSFPAEEEPLLSFDTWQKRVEAAPKMLTRDDMQKQIGQSLIAKNDFRQTHADFLATMRAGSSQSQVENWLNKKEKSSLFASKISVDPDATIIFHGDIHGDIHSLMMLLRILQTLGYLSQDDGFSIKDTYKDSFYMVFLGDYVDRGWYGLEVLYTLMRLKIANPDNVFLLRGNHEDPLINTRYGFLRELIAKGFTGNDSQSIEFIYEPYEYLPSALLLSVEGSTGKDVLQCHHGGLELGFDPKPLLAAPQKHAFQWIAQLDRAPTVTAIPRISDYIFVAGSPLMAPGRNSLTDYLEFSGKPNTQILGFLWSDFIVNQEDILTFAQNRGLSFGKAVTQDILKLHSTPHARIRGVIRAHQHSGSATPMMRMLLQPDASEAQNLGLARLWKDETNQDMPPNRLWDRFVYTLNVSPFTPYGVGQKLGQFDFDTFALLTLDDKFKNWDLQVHRTYANKTGRERFPSFNQFKEATKSFLRKRKKTLAKKLLELYTSEYEKLSYQLNQLAQMQQ